MEEIRELFHIENDFTPEEEVRYKIFMSTVCSTNVVIQLAMQIERSEIEMLHDVGIPFRVPLKRRVLRFVCFKMMGRQIEGAQQQPSTIAGKARKRITSHHTH